MFSTLGDKSPLLNKKRRHKEDSRLLPSSTVWVGLDTQNGTMAHEAVQAQNSTAGQLVEPTVMKR